MFDCSTINTNEAFVVTFRQYMESTSNGMPLSAIFESILLLLLKWTLFEEELHNSKLVSLFGVTKL